MSEVFQDKQYQNMLLLLLLKTLRTQSKNSLKIRKNLLIMHNKITKIQLFPIISNPQNSFYGLSFLTYKKSKALLKHLSISLVCCEKDYRLKLKKQRLNTYLIQPSTGQNKIFESLIVYFSGLPLILFDTQCMTRGITKTVQRITAKDFYDLSEHLAIKRLECSAALNED